MVANAHLADRLLDHVPCIALRQPRMPFSIAAEVLEVLLRAVDLLHWYPHDNHVSLAFTLRCLRVEKNELAIPHNRRPGPEILRREVLDGNSPPIWRRQGLLDRRPTGASDFKSKWIRRTRTGFIAHDHQRNVERVAV